jgi:threonine/homoserine/homoserine lactone efflux protein
MTVMTILAFAGLCLALALTPGPDTFLVLRYGMVRVRDGIAAAAGVALGSLIWAALVAGGLAAVFEQSAELYRAIKIVGGVYLIYLGVMAFVSARRRARAVDAPSDEGAVASRAPGASLFAGVLSTLLNPKVGLFFIAVMPQFASAEATFGETMLLGAVDALVGGAYLVAVALLSARLVSVMRRPRVARAVEGATGAILAALGIGTIASTADPLRNEAS